MTEKFDSLAPSVLGKGTIISIQSHVSYGHAGNSAALFPMQRLGYNVASVNTVLFSNHTGYGAWQGDIVGLDTIEKVLCGLEDRGVFPLTEALVTGYMGSSALGDVIGRVCARIKEANPKAVYVCDTVFGDVGRGMFASEEIATFFRDTALGICDIATPNLFETEWMSGMKITSIETALQAGRRLLDKGCKALVITSLEVPEIEDTHIAMLAMTQKDAWLVKTPKVDLPIAPNGSGDATTAIFCTHYLDAVKANPAGEQAGQAEQAEQTCIATALEKTAASIYAIFQETARCQTRELQIIASGDAIAHPKTLFSVEKITV